MRIYLAGSLSYPKVLWQNKGNQKGKDNIEKNTEEYHPYILQSFYYTDKETEGLLPHFGDFLLDSGAFTFFGDKNAKQDIDAYLELYCDFIKKNKIAKFFELDIDVVVGYERVKQIRNKLERITGRQTIPVWHKSRGIDEFKKLARDYPYIAVGASGQHDSAWTRTPQGTKILRSMVDFAHENNCKIHGLGYTSLTNLNIVHWDSVDSTAWLSGNRFGGLFAFKDGKIGKIEVPEGKRLNQKKAALHNFTEWCKFQKWADVHL